MVKKFDILQKPINVGKLVLKHRMIMAPMAHRLWAENGETTQRVIDYFSARAKGGAALITVGILQVQADEAGFQPRADDDRYIPGLQRLTETIHSDGVPIIAQLHHGGPIAVPPVSPSGIPCLTTSQKITVPRAMSLDEIEEMRDFYIEAAVRAKKAGFDGVELHGAQIYLLQQFISPRLNKRTDRYGGSLENRMRLQLEIVRGIRQKCGSEFVVGYALVADDLIPDGIVLEESVPFAIELEKEGVDYVDIRQGIGESFLSARGTGHSKHQSRAGIWEYSEPFKKALKVPVFCATQGCYDPVLWEEALERGQADVVSLAKPLLCDPEMPRKILEGRFDDIRPCILCLFCTDREARGGQTTCDLNPELGRERDYAIKQADHPKRVLVVGGGPGGLEAARVAALRGHKVTVIDMKAEPGGKLRLLGLCAGNDLYLSFCDWLVGQCTKAGVKFELNKEVTPQVIKDAKPDVVIVATGAPQPIIPPIHGIQKPHVITPEEVLTGKARVGENVVVLGGSLIGVDMACTIAAKGLAESIIIVEPWSVPTLAYDMSTLNRIYILMALLPKYKVQGFTGMRIEEITDREVVGIDREGKRQKIKGDTVVNALGYGANVNLYEALRRENQEIYAIGDCVKARAVGDAINEGAHIARQI